MLQKCQANPGRAQRDEMKAAGVNKTWDGAPALPPLSWVALGKLINLSGTRLYKQREQYVALTL